MASIYKRDKTWTAMLSYQENGRRKRASKTGFSTKSGARAWATAKEAELQKSGSSKLSKQNVSDYFQDWFDTYKAPRLAPASHRRYMATKAVIGRYFGNRAVSSIGFDDYQKFINDLAVDHSIASVQKIHGQFRSAIKKGYQTGKIPIDFTEGAELSGLPGKKQEEKFLDLDDMEKLLNYSEENIYDITDVTKAMFVTALLTGMRYEEVIGLTWDCVSYRHSTVKINKVWYYIDSDWGPTKNEQSNRIIKADESLFEMLKKWRKITDEFLKSHHYTNPHNFVFLSRTRYPVSSKDVNMELKRLYRDHVFSKKITFHGLRHTHASYLLSDGVPLPYVSKRLGHANTIVTQTTYAHVFKRKRMQDENKAIEALDKLHKK